MSRSALTALSALGASIAATACLAPAAHAQAPACTAYAAPNGSDNAAGTLSAPKQSVQALADSLNPGDTGCLRGGTWSTGVVFRKGGTATARVTLRSAPGEKATINGEVRVAKSAPYVTVSGLYINGASIDKTNPTINAPYTTFTNNDVTNDHTKICFMLGNSEWGRADNALIAGNRIHDCGKLPSKNMDHGIYIAAATGARIQNNWIYDNADRGIQLYPDAQRTTITGNIIDNNGEGIIISGEGEATSGTRIERNVISNSNIRGNIESWWAQGTTPGADNTVGENCLYASNPNAWYSRNAGVNTDGGGFTVDSTNVQAAPSFADRGGRDLRLTANSACRRMLGDAADTIAGPGTDAGEAPLPAVPAGPSGQSAQPLPTANVDLPATPAPTVVATKPAAGSKPAPASAPAEKQVVRRPARTGSITLRVASARQARASTVGRAATVSLTGTIRGLAAGQSRAVTIQALVRGRWIAVGRTQARAGRSFSAAVAAPKGFRGGRLQLRASAAGLGSSAPVSLSLAARR